MTRYNFASWFIFATLSSQAFASGTLRLVEADAIPSVDGTSALSLGHGPGTPQRSAVRQVNSDEALTDPRSPGIACGPNALRAAETLPVLPGETIRFLWRQGRRNGAYANWNETVGPLMSYITPCNGPCSKFDHDGATWFKFSQLGKKDDGSGLWFQSDLTAGKIKQVPSIVVPNVPEGEYLIRNEVIVLDGPSNSIRGKFYVACTQVTVSGNAALPDAALPTTAQGVEFPGAYSPVDPGILVTSLNAPYIFPGGEIAQFGESTTKQPHRAIEPSGPASTASVGAAQSAAPGVFVIVPTSVGPAFVSTLPTSTSQPPRSTSAVPTSSRAPVNAIRPISTQAPTSTRLTSAGPSSALTSSDAMPSSYQHAALAGGLGGQNADVETVTLVLYVTVTPEPTPTSISSGTLASVTSGTATSSASAAPSDINAVGLAGLGNGGVVDDARTGQGSKEYRRSKRHSRSRNRRHGGDAAHCDT